MDVEERLEEHRSMFSFGVGLLFGIALLELFPEAWEAGWGALLGAVLIFLFFLWYRLTTGRHGLEGIVLLGFFVHAAMEGGSTAMSFAAGTTTGIAAVVGLALHELPEFAAVAAVFTGFGRSLREVGVYQVTAIAIVTVSFALVFFLLGRIPAPVIAVGLGAAAGAFSLLGMWDAYEIATGLEWMRGIALGGGVLVIAGLKLAGLL